MRILKRYRNRKIYDTKESRYMSLGEIGELVKSGEEFKVVAEMTGEDITAITLLQIIAVNPMNSNNIELLKELITNNTLQSKWFSVSFI